MANINKIRYNGEYYDIGSNNNYSTEEQVIGTWIDGKPLYRIVIVQNVPSFTTKTSFNLASCPNNIQEVVSINGCFISDRDDINLNYYYGADDYTRTWVNKQSSTIRMNSASTGLSNVFTAKIILEYTKTTD